MNVLGWALSCYVVCKIYTMLSYYFRYTCIIINSYCYNNSSSIFRLSTLIPANRVREPEAKHQFLKLVNYVNSLAFWIDNELSWSFYLRLLSQILDDIYKFKTFHRYVHLRLSLKLNEELQNQIYTAFFLVEFQHVLV